MRIRAGVCAVAVFLACLLPAGMALAMESGIAIRAGLARQGAQGRFAVYKDTTTIPFVSHSVDPNYYFGVSATVASGRKLPCHVVAYIPKGNRVHGTAVEQSGARVTSGDAYKIVTSEDVLSSACEIYVDLDDDDAPGKYIVEIFIGGKMVGRVVFDVLPK